MSRSGYRDDFDDNWTLIRWRGAVAAAIRGKRGQTFLRELLAALDAMPQKRLVKGAFEEGGEVCALGAVARVRGLDLKQFDPDDPDQTSSLLNIADALAREIMEENDGAWVEEFKEIRHEICGPVRPWYPDFGRMHYVERVHDEKAPERRWAYVRQWVAEQIIEAPAASPEDVKP